MGEQPDAGPAGVALQALAEHAPFEVTIEGAGAFPNAARPRVLWLGVGQGAHELEAVAASLRGALRAQGVSFDEKPFRPHLTVQRVKHGRPRLVVPPGELARFRADHVNLVHSLLGHGARHLVLARTEFRGHIPKLPP